MRDGGKRRERQVRARGELERERKSRPGGVQRGRPECPSGAKAQGTRAGVRGQDKIRGAGAQSGSKATASQRTRDTASKSADALNRR